MPGTAGVPDFGPPEEGVKRIPEVEAHVQAMETSLGVRHPRVSALPCSILLGRLSLLQRITMV